MRNGAVMLMAVLAFGATGAAAQDTCDVRRSDRTVAPPDARFEILRADGEAETFRLDKVTGEVWRLKQSTSKFSGFRMVWDSVPPPQQEEEPAGTALRYQLFAPRYGAVVLHNVHSGASWMLRFVSGEHRWEPLTFEK